MWLWKVRGWWGGGIGGGSGHAGGAPHVASTPTPVPSSPGVVLPAKAALSSQYHGGMQGVIQKLLLKEHRLVWNSLARSW